MVIILTSSPSSTLHREPADGLGVLGGTFFYTSLYGIVVNVLTILFEFIAFWLNDFENHRTQTTYMNRLILKVFSFQFVSIFTSLYYYAFFSRDHEGGVFSNIRIGFQSDDSWSVVVDFTGYSSTVYLPPRTTVPDEVRSSEHESKDLSGSGIYGPKTSQGRIPGG